MNISARLKYMMSLHKVSIPELSKSTGISVNTIKNYIYKGHEPRAKAMAALERYFNVNGTYLRGEELTVEEVAHNIQILAESLHKSSSSSIVASAKLISAVAESVECPVSSSAVASAKLASAASEVVAQNRDKMLLLFSSLSTEGQQEMLKRMEEYQVVDDIKKGENSSSSQDEIS